MLLVHKIELSPNNRQATYFAKACGTSRFAYNWALARWRSEYEAGRRTSEINLRQDLNVIKAGSFPWMLEVTKVAPQQAKMKLARLHRRIGNIRNDALHKLTTNLVLNNHLIGIEDLNVKGMVKNHNLARSIIDQSFGEFRRQLEYKAQWYGSEVVKADRFFPSTRMCSTCGVLHEMPLSKRIMACECGNVMDRDLNAAINLEHVAVSSTETENACGAESAGSMATPMSETTPCRSRNSTSSRFSYV